MNLIVDRSTPDGIGGGDGWVDHNTTIAPYCTMYTIFITFFHYLMT